jgi:hypothetical protein
MRVARSPNADSNVQASATSGTAPSILRCDHVWSFRPGFGLITATTGGGRGDPRGFWLVLASSGEVSLYRAHGKHPDFSRQPTFVSSSPAATKAKVRGRGLVLQFGTKRRVVQFTGKTEAPRLRSLVGFEALGEVGVAIELAQLGMEMGERKQTKRRAQAVKDAWLEVLLGHVPWTAMSPNQMSGVSA